MIEVKFTAPYRNTQITVNGKTEVVGTKQGVASFETEEQMQKFMFNNPQIKVYEVTEDIEYEEE